MRKNRNTTSPEIKRFGVSDILIILLCVLGAAGASSFFWTEFNRTQVKLNEAPVGMVTYRNRTAHRRFEERVIWDRLKEASPVYNGDTIRVADLSDAVITFIDDTTSIDLSENTLVQIFYSGGGTRVDLSGGGLVVNSGGTGEVLVSSGENAVSLAGGSSAGINSDGLGFDLSVTEGEAGVNGKIVKSGSMQSFTKDGAVNTAPVIAVTSLGSAARILNYGGEAPVHFSWNASNFSPDTVVVVEVALDRAFNDIVERRQVQGENSVIISLENGSYWWHAYPSEDGAIRVVQDRFLTSGRIDVASSVPASPLEPADGRELSFSGESRIALSWTTMEGVSRYFLELADNAAMANSAVSREVEGSSFLVKGLAEGTWYWRVTPVFPSRVKGNPVPSAVREFSVVQSKIPPVPEPTVPAENAELNISGETITLGWAWDSAAASWKFEAADNPEMKNPLVSEIVYSNFYSVNPGRLKLVPGSSYYWRVSALSGDGGSSAPSPTRSFIAVAVPEPGARLAGQPPGRSAAESRPDTAASGPAAESPEGTAVTAAAETTAEAPPERSPSATVSLPESPEAAAETAQGAATGTAALTESAGTPLPVENLGGDVVAVSGNNVTLRHNFAAQRDLVVSNGKTFIIPAGMILDLSSTGIILENNAVFTVEGTVNVAPSFTTIKVSSAVSTPARINGNGIVHLTRRGRLLNIGSRNKLILENVTLDGLTTASQDGDTIDNNSSLVEITAQGELEMRGTAAITGNTNIQTLDSGGGGITINGGRLIMSGKSRVAGNSVSSISSVDGGGLFVIEGAVVMNDQSSITGNLARAGKDHASGGGVRLWNSSLTMNDEARIADNTVTYRGGWTAGGGISMDGSATLTMNGGTIEGNRLVSTDRGGSQLHVYGGSAQYGNGKIITISGGVNTAIRGQR
jgi:hypothetical protein